MEKDTFELALEQVDQLAKQNRSEYHDICAKQLTGGVRSAQVVALIRLLVDRGIIK